MGRNQRQLTPRTLAQKWWHHLSLASLETINLEAIINHSTGQTSYKTKDVVDLVVEVMLGGKEKYLASKNQKKKPMEGELRNFIFVLTSVFASLCYCHSICKFIPKGSARLLTLFPIVCLFLYLPLKLRTLHLGVTTAFFIAWLANFKLLLFAFEKGPLSSSDGPESPPISFPRFLLFATLPIKCQHNPPQDREIGKYPPRQNSKNCPRSPLNYVKKITLVGVLVEFYKHKDHVHPKIVQVSYCLHIYLILEMLLALVACLVRAAAGIELDPHFDAPHLATSLQNFWGRRWNLVVSGILRLAVYDPAKSISGRLIGRKRAWLPALLATFLVSALMHELIFYYAGRVRPTFEVTSFFLLHGICVAAEIEIKKALNGRFCPPPVLSRLLVVGFVLATSLWLFLPPFLRFEADVMVKKETVAFVEFMMDIRSVKGFNLIKTK